MRWRNCRPTSRTRSNKPFSNGAGLFGQSVLLARRLIEAGVTFVTVHTEAKPNGHWDTHNNNFKMLQLKSLRWPKIFRVWRGQVLIPVKCLPRC